jgi:hypothetical protein
VIGERLLAARKQAEQEHDRVSDGPRAALVLRGKELEVRDYYQQASRARGSWRGHRISFSSQQAVQRARADAQKARLEPAREIGGQRPAVAS